MHPPFQNNSLRGEATDPCIYILYYKLNSNGQSVHLQVRKPSSSVSKVGNYPYSILGMIYGVEWIVGFLFGVAQVFCLNLRPQIPSVRTFTAAATQDPFPLSASVKIVVDPQWKDLGSPSLNDFAKTFRADLVDLLGFRDIPNVVAGSPDDTPTIYLTLETTLNHTLFNGQATGEGYDFEITSLSYIIRALEPIGVWWGTRTLLQQAALLAQGAGGGGSETILIPAGAGSDSPGWGVRGFMLDVGRHFFLSPFLSDLCIYASFFKINEFHIHASDYVWNPALLYGQGWRDLYTGFRFLPSPSGPNAGLVPNTNESWTQEEFQIMQSNCAAHGVAIIPEIDTPGHSLVITKWKPGVMIPGKPDLLDLSNPDTLPTVQSIWEEFLPWFTATEVSIGADEYESSLADDYISFVNNMSDFIHRQSGKSMRVWGTNEPSTTLSISQNVTIQHWHFPGESVPVQLMQKGYSIINSELAFLYLDGKTSVADGQLPWELVQDLMWGGAPGGSGWAPNIFSKTDSSSNTGINNPFLRGAIMALWNDWGNNASTPLEEYYQLARSLAVFSEKAWAGSDTRSTALTRAQFDDVYPILNAAAPGQNLNRVVVPQYGNIVFQYNQIPTLPVFTDVPSVGPPYTLKFTVTPSSSSPSVGTLFTGLDSSLHVDGLAFRDVATNEFYPLGSGYTLPPGRTTTVEIHASRDYTFAIIDGQQIAWTSRLTLWGTSTVTKNMSFAAPSLFIGGGGFGGQLSDVVLSLGS